MTTIQNMKECNTCNEILPINVFNINKKNNKIFYRNKCKCCRLLDAQKRRELQKLSIKEEVTHKECNMCLLNLEITDFNKNSLSKDGHDNVCRDCYKIIRHKNKQPVHNNITEVYCTKCKTTKKNTEFRTYARSSTGYFNTCNSCWKPSEWNTEKQRMAERRYVLNNPDKIREKYKRQSKNPNRIIRHRLNKRITLALQTENIRKSNKTHTFIGCDIEYLKKWLEFQFNNNICWENIGEWHIDHVIPCSNYDLTNEEQQKLCFNWQNLRPCLAKENIQKGDKIIQTLIDSHKQLVSKFIQINPLPTQPSNRVEGTE
jgi:hypothetical protein